MVEKIKLIDNYLKKAIHDKENIVKVLDYLFFREAKAKCGRDSENHIKMAGFPFKKSLDTFDFEFQPSIDKS